MFPKIICWLFLFVSWGITDNEKEIVKLANEIVSAPGSHRKNQTYIIVGDYFFNKGKYNIAIEYYRKVTSKKEVLSELDLLIQKTRSELNKLEETTLKKETAIKYWELAKLESINEQVSSMSAPEIYAKFQIGRSYFELNDFSSAEKIFNELINSASDEAIIKEAYVNLMLCYTKSKRFKDAKKHIFDIRNATPSVRAISNKIEFILLSSLAENELYNEIVKEFEEGTFSFLKSLGPEKPKEEKKIEISKEEKKLEISKGEKKPRVSKEEKEEKKLIDDVYSQALKHYTKGEMLRATEILNDIIKKHPEASKKARALLTKIKTDVETQALRFISKEKAYYNRAYLSYCKGKLDESIYYWDKVLKENPDNEEVKEFLNKYRKTR